MFGKKKKIEKKISEAKKTSTKKSAAAKTTVKKPATATTKTLQHQNLYQLLNLRLYILPTMLIMTR